MPRIKTKEAILKANLAKTMGRLKTRVADSEEIWLDTFGEVLNTLIGTYGSAMQPSRLETFVEDVVKLVPVAREIADKSLDEYETRWGKG